MAHPQECSPRQRARWRLQIPRMDNMRTAIADDGARSGNRTRIPFRMRDFKSKEIFFKNNSLHRFSFRNRAILAPLEAKNGKGSQIIAERNFASLLGPSGHPKPQHRQQDTPPSLTAH